MLQEVRCCRRCGVAGFERVPPLPFGCYFETILKLPLKTQQIKTPQTLSMKGKIRIHMDKQALSDNNQFSSPC